MADNGLNVPRRVRVEVEGEEIEARVGDRVVGGGQNERSHEEIVPSADAAKMVWLTGQVKEGVSW